MRVLSAIGTALLAAVLAGIAIGVLGTLLYEVPVLGVAAGFVTPLMSWVVPFAVAAGILAVLLWRARRGRVAGRIAIVLVVVAALTAGGGTFVIARQVAAVRAAGADIDLIDTLGLSEPPSATPDADETYATFDGEPLGLSVFRPTQTRAPAPVLVFIHGGGWVAGERNAHSADLRWFADQGWLTISVDYPLSSPQRHLWDVVPSQIGCALSWVAANAERYGGDGTRLSLSGDSAGGNLAIVAGFMAAQGSLRSSCGGRVPTVSAVSTLYPATDAVALYDNDDPVFGTTSHDFAAAHLGGSPTEFPDRYTSVRASTYIAANAPPVLILLGGTDHLVPVADAYAFADRARAAGIEVDLVSVPYADHVFDVRPGSIGQQAFRQLTATWLREHGQTP